MGGACWPGGGGSQRDGHLPMLVPWPKRDSKCARAARGGGAGGGRLCLVLPQKGESQCNEGAGKKVWRACEVRHGWPQQYPQRVAINSVVGWLCCSWAHHTPRS